MGAWEDHVRPHGELVQLAPRLWVVTGTLPRGPLPRNMTIHRLADGGLLLHSVVALNPAGMEALEALGRPQVMIVPNPYHRLDAAVYRVRYPNMQVLAPAAARAKVEAEVKVDRSAEEMLDSVGVTVHTLGGTKPGELVYELTIDDESGKALIFCDAIFNVDPMRGLGSSIANFLSSAGRLTMGRLGRFVMLSDKEAFRAWLVEMSNLPGLKVVIMAHGKPLTEDVGAKLAAAAAEL
jgi:hypothetical protein